MKELTARDIGKLSTNPYDPVEPIANSSPQRLGWVTSAMASMALPLVVAVIQRWTNCSSVVWLLALAVAMTIALTLLHGPSRMWGFLLSLVLFVKFTILASLIDLVFYGFDNAPR